MSVQTFPVARQDEALEHLRAHGYTVVENVLDAHEVRRYRELLEAQFERERREPFDPPDGEPAPGDDELEGFFRESYSVSEAELGRLMRRLRRSRSENAGTTWPVSASQVNKTFLHVPTLFDHDDSQRLWGLVAKEPAFADLAAHPTVVGQVRAVLGDDCVLSDCSGTTIGPRTAGGAWHVDAPFGQLEEPLPDIPLTVQNAWALVDFTADNGATRVVPDSHLTRKKPVWGEAQDDAVTLEAPAGSVAVWLSNTWHASGPNSTDAHRPAVLCYYSRSWIKPFQDYVSVIDPDIARTFPAEVRYLLGFSARAPLRR